MDSLNLLNRDSGIPLIQSGSGRASAEPLSRPFKLSKAALVSVTVSALSPEGERVKVEVAWMIRVNDKGENPRTSVSSIRRQAGSR
jgi:hypothetical protein